MKTSREHLTIVLGSNWKLLLQLVKLTSGFLLCHYTQDVFIGKFVPISSFLNLVNLLKDDSKLGFNLTFVLNLNYFKGIFGHLAVKDSES